MAAGVICGSGCAGFRQPASIEQAGNKAPAGIILSKLDHAYDGRRKSVRARTDPRGLAVSITYDGGDAAPVSAGSYAVAAAVQDTKYEGSASGTMTIAKVPQKITFKTPAVRTYGDSPFELSAGASSGLMPVYESSDPAVATISNDQVTIVGAGIATITASQPGDNNYLPAEPVQQTLTVNKAPAQVILSSLDPVYDGAPKPAAAATEPNGLNAGLAYDDSETAPVNAGKYKVTAVVRDANYEGSARGTLRIRKAANLIAFPAVATVTYGAEPFDLSAATSSGLAAVYTSSDPAVATISNYRVKIIGAGIATITASQPGDNNHLPAEPVQQTLTVNKAPARVTLSGLDHTYDGKPKSVGSKSEPPGLIMRITYDGSDAVPVNAGSYQVIATVRDANYEGSATGTMAIAKAAQTIAFPALLPRTYGDRSFDLSAGLSSGFKPVYESSNPSIATITNDRVKIIGAGISTITASQPGDNNHLPAEPVHQKLTVNKAPARVTLSGLDHTYDGKPKSVGSKAEPDGLIMRITYDGTDAVPVNAGSYQVIATVRDANYEGSATGTMTIAKAAQKIRFDAMTPVTYSEISYRMAAAVSSGLTATYDSSNPEVATISNDQIMIKGVGAATITAFQAGDNNYLPATPVQQTFTVSKAPVRITLGDLDQIFDGTARSAKAATVPAGLTVGLTYNGDALAPVNAGSYNVAATVRDANYEGGAIGTMTIAKAPQTITLNALSPRTYGDEMPYLLFAAPSSGLTATYGSSDPSVATISSDQVMIRGVGTTTITAYQAGNSNYEAAAPVERVLSVNKASATVILNDLDQTYDGTPKPAGATTSRGDLTVSFTYDGGAEAPADAGRYRVLGAIQDANYEGIAIGTMTIAKAPQMITFPALAARTLSEMPFELPASASSGLTPAYESSDAAVAAIIGSQVKTVGAGAAMITAYQAGDGNYESAGPAKRLLIVRSQKPRIAVLPVENLSGKQAPLKEIRRSLIEGLIKQGASVPDEGDFEQFMVRHRVRYIGGVDTATAQAWKEEAGMEAVLITSVDQYEDSDPPKIALTSRLVSTGKMPYIMWMDNIGFSGDDAPGLFGIGLIEQIGPLQDKAVKQLLASVAEYYADTALPANNGPSGLFKPKTAYRSPFLVPDKMYTVAVMPFFNRSKNSKAGEIIALRFAGQLTKYSAFQVLEPGVVRQKLLNFRVIMRDGVSREVTDSFFNNLETDLVLIGRVLEYEEGNTRMEFDIQVYEKKSREMVWSSWSHNQGSDGVFFFDWRRVNNAGVLASKMAKTAVRTMINEIINQ